MRIWVLFLFTSLFVTTEVYSTDNECIEVELNSELKGEILNLNFEFRNSCNKSIYFINNLWLFEFADDLKFAHTSERDEIRFNRMYFYQDTPLYYRGDIVEEEMSKFNFNDIYQLKEGKQLVISFRLKLTSTLNNIAKSEGFKYKVKLLFSEDNWNNYINSDKIRPEILTIFQRFNSYGYSNSKSKTNYLKENCVFIKTIEGKLEFKKK